MIPGVHHERLKAELDRLKSLFQRGHSLTVRHLPGQLRHSPDGKRLCGEVQKESKTILIYEAVLDKAIPVLYHEFIEFCFIYPLEREFYEVLQYQREMLAQKEQMLVLKDEVINKLLMHVKEQTVDGLSIPVGKLMGDV